MNEQLNLNMKGFNYNIGWKGHCFLEAMGVGGYVLVNDCCERRKHTSYFVHLVLFLNTDALHSVEVVPHVLLSPFFTLFLEW